MPKQKFGRPLQSVPIWFIRILIHFKSFLGPVFWGWVPPYFETHDLDPIYMQFGGQDGDDHWKIRMICTRYVGKPVSFGKDFGVSRCKKTCPRYQNKHNMRKIATYSFFLTPLNVTFHRKWSPKSQFWNLTFRMKFFLRVGTLTLGGRSQDGGTTPPNFATYQST